jgi:ribosomal protein L7/L12
MSTKHTVAIVGWNEGFQTIDMMKLVRSATGMHLGDAMAVVNRVVEGGTEELHFSTPEAAEAFCREARKIGAKVEMRDA